MPEQPQTTQPTRSSAQRLGKVMMAIIIVIAFTGLVVGIKAGKTLGPPETESYLPDIVAEDAAAAINTGELPPAPAYRHMGDAPRGPNQDWHNSLDKLIEMRPDLFAPVETSTELKLESLAQREATRAYNGAPPVVPHPMDQRTSDNCLACHQNGLMVGSAIAAPLPHPAFPNCAQCHVEGSSTMFPQAARRPVTASLFQGVEAPTGGQRAWPGAPPTIPHTTWMRDNCNACHGTLGEPGLRTTHPWRNNCQQCHAPSADYDQVTTSPMFANPGPIFSSEPR